MLTKILDGIDSLSEWTGRAISWLTLAMALVMFLVVVLRYAFNTGSIALQESVSYLHAAVFLLGAAYTLKQGGHVRVDIFYQRMSARRRALVDTAGGALLLLPTCIFTLVISLPYVANSWRLLEGSREPGGLPAVFLLKTLIPLAMALLALQGVAHMARAVRQLIGLGSDER